MNKSFKERLNELMKETGISQSSIVHKTKINKGALSCYLKGMYNPKRDNIDKLASFFNVNPDWLEGKDVPKNPDYLHVDYNNKDSINKYFDIIISISVEELNKETVELIAQVLKNKKIIKNTNELTKKTNTEILEYLDNIKSTLIDKKILIDIKTD